VKKTIVSTDEVKSKIEIMQKFN